MPRPRTPKAKAKATGQDELHKPRFKSRAEPEVDSPLGDPPKWLKKASEREAWETLREEYPWLNKSHRTHVALACVTLGRFIEGQEVGVQAHNLLRVSIGQMGGSPADASKVTMPDGKKSNEDPSAKYF